MNINFLINTLKIKTSLAFIILAIFTLSSCGKRKPPLPPVEKVSQRVEITGFQRGGQVVLAWRMPARNADQNSILNVSRVDIYRLAETAALSQAVSEEDFSSRSTLIASLPITADDFGLKQVTYTDTLEFSNQAATLRYAVRFVNKSGQKAGFSNFLLIEPSAQIADKPQTLTAGVTETAIKLKWLKPEKNVDGSAPPNLTGFNIYRSNSAAQTAVLLNEKPLIDAEYADQKFEFGRSYLYFVRSVSGGTNGKLVESGESNIVSVTPKDVFPPTPPTALTIAASPQTLSIFFAVNPEKDVAGYRIYRSENAALDKSQWRLVTPELSTANTFQDKNVESGVKYYYYLTAVDNAGNVSQPSETVSETAL